MNEMIEEYKKSNHYKKKKMVNALLVFIFMGIVASCVLYYIYTQKKAKEQSYTYRINNNIVTISKNGKVLNSYTCESNCNIYNNYFRFGKIILEDGNNYYLYDLVNNKKLTNNLSKIYFIYSSTIEKLENINYILAENNESKWGVIDLGGNEIIPFEYDELGKVIDDKLYNYLPNYYYITANINGKIGVLSITENKMLIKPQYEDIILFNNERISVKENDWKLVNVHNIQLLDETYDSLFVLENNILVTKDNYFYLIDFKGNEVSNKEVLYYAADYWKKTGLTYSYNKDGNLEVKTDNDEIYEYSETTARFTKK